ncbi:MAG: hypothetical protein HY816_20005 [Candidatus Wallbacteria bacterium]|nr:hypothetical protein [Candidatus Wallbacteria bacterium]
MIRVDIEVGDLLGRLDALSDLANTRQAILEAGQFVRATWIDLAIQHSSSGSYVNGIQDVEPFADGFGVQVVNTAPHAAVVELGHGGFHLPSRINWGAAPRVKVSTTGVRYLTIPFRHFTPQRAASGPSLRAQRNMMPRTIYALAKDLAASASLSGPMQPRVRRSGYRWGGRLDLSDRPKLFNPSTLKTPMGHPIVVHRDHWASHRFQGMVRFSQGNPETKSHSSTYLTFRTLTENSPNWNIPPLEGQHYTKRVLSPANVERIRQIVANGVMRDLAGYHQVGAP